MRPPTGESDRHPRVREVILEDVVAWSSGVRRCRRPGTSPVSPFCSRFTLSRQLFENLKDGATVNDFLKWYPGTTREQVDAVLEHEIREMRALIVVRERIARETGQTWVPGNLPSAR